MYSPSADNIGMDLTVPTVRMVNKSADRLVVGDVVVMSTAHTGVVYPPATRTEAVLSPLACVVKAGSSPFTPGFIGTVARLGMLDGRTNDTVDVVFGGLAKAKVAAVTTDVVLGTQLSLSSTTGQLTNDATGRVVAVALQKVTAGQTANIDVILDGEIAADTATLGTFATLAVTGTASVGGVATFNGGIISTGTAAAPTSNTVIGNGAGAALQSGGTNNVLLGSSAGAAITTGDEVVAIGFNAAALNTANDTVAIGSGALDANTTGILNTAVGRNALGANIDGASNTAVGHNAGLLQTTASNNTIVGASAGDAVTTANNITLIGQNAGGALTTGFSVTAVGQNAASLATTASQITAIGQNALRDVTGGSNTAVGTDAMVFATTAISNTAIGVAALRNNLAGSSNTVIGVNSARYIGTATTDCTRADSSIFIGNDSRPSGDTESNQIVIAAAGRGNGSNTTVIGTTSTTQSRMFGGTFLSTGANGQSTQLGQATQLLTGLTGATVTATNLIPANCILLGVTARVTTAITGATTFDIGDGSTANRFGDDIAIALDTTANNCIAPALIAAATNVVLTANGSNFTAGAVRVTAHFITLVAPTS